MAIREGDWKIVRAVTGRDGPPGSFELYDLSKDFKETRDLAKQHPEIVDRLRKKLLAWNCTLTAPGWIEERQNPWLTGIYGKAGMTPYKAEGYSGRLPGEVSSRKPKNPRPGRKKKR